MTFLEQIPTESRNIGWIEIICGSMFSGKTEELIRRLKRVEFAKQELILFKPNIDNRYSESEVVSHKGSSIDAIQVRNAAEIRNQWKNQKVVAIDEVQFFDPEIVTVCNELADKGVRVILAGLDMDYQGKPFGPIANLMCVAEYVTKVHAICVTCGNLAHYSHRTSNEKGQVLVGAVEKYEPLCRTCYTKIAL